jgi:hypothetical protein
MSDAFGMRSRQPFGGLSAEIGGDAPWQRPARDPLPQ